MKFKSIAIVVVVVACVAIVVNTFVSNTSGEYRDQIERERDEKNHYMKTSKASPFVTDSIDFTALSYFPVDERYRIIADLIPAEEKKPMQMPTSDGKTARFVPYAYAAFDLGNRHHRLLILESIDMGPARGTLFLGFGDKTNAVETYGGGRYLDVKKSPGSATITLDFNLAYNPYCAYTDSYTCPLPPQENILEVPIPAGEKNYHP